MNIYKIRDKTTGKFSTGGRLPNFTKGGKMWRTAGQLRAHLTLVSTSPYIYRHFNLNKIPDNWEVVEYEITEKTSQDCKSFYNKT